MNPALDNLEKLTEDLYQKLVKDAQVEIDRLNAEAREERDRLLADAQTKLEADRKTAEREIQQYRERSLQELKQEILHIKGELKASLEAFLHNKMIARPLEAHFKDGEFVKELLFNLLNNFDPKSYRLVWPKDWDEKWLDAIRAELPNWNFDLQAGKSLLIRESEKGLEFHIGPEEFSQLLQNHFQSDLRALLFSDDWVLLHTKLNAGSVFRQAA